MNPFKTHAQNLFSQRATVDEALAYARDVINGMETSQQAAAWTALMVVVNTAAKVWPEAEAQEPSTQVSILLSRQDLDALIESKINDWASDEFDARADEWLNDHADLDHEIERWVENNLDVEDEVQDALRNASLRINF